MTAEPDTVTVLTGMVSANTAKLRLQTSKVTILVFMYAILFVN
jgi:hypothetical protein